jgi:hypothetical protein
MKTLCKIFLLLVFVVPSSFATHLLGGEIRAERISNQSLKFKISVHLYLDLLNGTQAAEAATSVPVCFGQGDVIEAPRVSLTNIGNNIGIGVYETTYTYPASGTFQIGALVSNRSALYLNSPNSELQSMFLWTVVNTTLPDFATPVLPYPVMQAGAKQVFTVDLKPAQNTDSTSVHLQSASKGSPGTCGVRSIDYDYFFPNDLTKSGIFKVDNVNKKLIWNAPEKAGKYLYAFVVDQWRDGIIISQSYHEATIFVTDRNGETVEIPPYEPVTTADGGGLLTANPASSPELSISLSAYPVPTESYLSFKVNSQTRSAINVQIVNLQGQVVRELNSSQAEVLFQDQFDMRLLPKGIYLIRAKNDRDSVVQKVVR